MTRPTRKRMKAEGEVLLPPFSFLFVSFMFYELGLTLRFLTGMRLMGDPKGLVQHTKLELDGNGL